MIYVYRRAVSEGADTLVEDICLQGTRARRTRGQLLERAVDGDFIVCWGDPLPGAVPRGVKVLNNVAGLSKFAEAQKLAEAGVSTVQVSRVRPAAQRRAPFTEATTELRGAQRISVADAEAIARGLLQFVNQETERRRQHEAQPLVQDEWLPRRNNHVGGSDLLTAPAQPDYYSKKENIVEEYRLHMFDGKSIRAGVKQQRPTRPNGAPSHPWIRSFDAGWIIAYENFQSTREQRDIAAKAIKALGLDFGAVDLGKRADGSLIVLEVNRAPGVEGGTAEAYARKIIAWTNPERN